MLGVNCSWHITLLPLCTMAMSMMPCVHGTIWPDTMVQRDLYHVMHAYPGSNMSTGLLVSLGFCHTTMDTITLPINPQDWPWVPNTIRVRPNGPRIMAPELMNTIDTMVPWCPQPRYLMHELEYHGMPMGLEYPMYWMLEYYNTCALGT